MKTKITNIGLLVCCVLAILAPNVSAAESIVAGEINESSVIEEKTREVMGDVREVIASGNSTYAIKSDGTLWAWGVNSYGVLGDGTNTTSTTSVKILDDVGKLYTNSSYNAYAIKNDGSLWAWGRGYYGLVGDGTTTDRYSPVKILDNVKQIAHTTSTTSFAIKNDNTLWAWGSNTYGLLGNGASTGTQSSPVQVLDNVKEIYHDSSAVFALKNDGSLWGWGINLYGRLGDGTTQNRLSPVKIMDGVKKLYNVGFNDRYSYALKEDNTLWSWGKNDYGQVGDGTTVARLSPVMVSDNVSGVWFSEFNPQTYDSRLSLYILKTDATLWAWGRNEAGQLGDGTTQNRLSPVKIMDDVKTFYDTSGFRSLSRTNFSGDHSARFSLYAIKNDSSLWGWGRNGNGQLGDGTTDDKASPIKILDNVRDVRQAVCGSRSRQFAGVYVIKTSNDLWWLGDGSVCSAFLADLQKLQTTPVFVVDDVKSLVAGGPESSGIRGVIKTTGSYYGLIETINYEDYSFTYSLDEQIHNVESIVCDNSGSSCSSLFAIDNSGILYAWGSNYFGQLGVGDTEDRRGSPVFVSGVGAQVPTLISGSKQIQLSLVSEAKLSSWDKLQVTNSGDLPSGAQISYSLAPGLCEANTAPADGFDDMNLGDEIDISALPTDTTDWCATVKYANIYSLNLNAKMGYLAEQEASAANGEAQENSENGENAGELLETGENLKIFASLAALCGVTGVMILRKIRG